MMLGVLTTLAQSRSTTSATATIIIVVKPTITWQSPQGEQITVKQPNFALSACVQSSVPLKSHQVILNGKELGAQRGMKRMNCGEQVAQEVTLLEGVNTLQIKATNSAGTTLSSVRQITYETGKEPSVASVGQKRLALIVANANYDKQALKNPINDGRSVKEELEKLGFAVTLKENLSLKDTEKTLEQFYTDLGKNNVGLFYYAGHGIMADNQNFIQPLGAEPATEVDARYVCYPLERVVSRMKNANPGGSNLVFWDACRTNPYRSWGLSRGQESAVYTTINPPAGTLIIYATEAGKPTGDGTGNNSPFTGQLVKHLQEPNLDIYEIVNRIDKGLEYKQPPYIEGRLRGQIVLNPR